MRLQSTYFALTLLVALLASCNKLEPPQPSAGNADLSRLVAFGGDFLSGYQDGALFRDGQRKSVAALLSDRFRLAGGDTLVQALLPQEGKELYYGIGLHPKPWEGDYATRSYLWYKTDCEGEESLYPLSGTYDEAEIEMRFGQDFISNQGITDFAIPSATLKDLCAPSFGKSYEQGNRNPFYYRIASEPGVSTALGDALKTQPTFAILWVGMEEIFNYASAGGYQKSIPPVSEFESRLDSVMQLFSAGGAGGVIANIPSLESFPFYTLVPYNGAEMEQGTADSLNDIFNLAQMPHIHFSAGENPFVVADENAQGGYRQLREGERILLTVPLDSMKCNFYGLLVNVIHNRYALTENELAVINDGISAYNAVIEKKAGQYGFAFCDMNNFFRSLSAGIKWNGVDYNLDFISGGFISLDAYHPNEKGYAMIANEMISVVNEYYGATVPPVVCRDCSGIRFP